MEIAMKNNAMNKHFLFFLLIIAFIVMTGLSIKESSAGQSGYINVIEIQPRAGNSLTSGSEVLIRVKVDYEIKEDSRAIELLIQKCRTIGPNRNESSRLGNVSQVLIQKKGQLTFEKEVKIPESGFENVELYIVLKKADNNDIIRSSRIQSYKIIKSNPS
jgi:uncharacterized membrane-anchored protein